MTQPRTHITRELDRRTGDGIEVRLLWCQNDGHVTVADTKTGAAFELPVRGASARSRCSITPTRTRRGAATASACPDHGLPFVLATTAPRGGSDATPHQHPTDCPAPTTGGPMTSTSPNINRWRAFALLAVSFFMTVIDLTIVNVSLPTIGRDLHFSATSLQWVVTAYALTFGGFMLLGGRAADLLGRRRILMVGLSLFTAASLTCGLATSDAFLIASRAVQGLGAAIMLPPPCRS